MIYDTIIIRLFFIIFFNRIINNKPSNSEKFSVFLKNSKFLQISFIGVVLLGFIEDCERLFQKIA